MAISTMKIGDLVELEWEDHFSHGAGWMPADEVQPHPELCRSVGYVIALTPKLITVAPTRDVNTEAVSGPMGRLRRDITKYKVLKGLK